MTTGNFSQFGAGERQYSDVESVQAPVEDRSAATRASAIAGGVEQLGKLGADLYSYNKQQQAQQSLLEQQSSFEKSLLKAGQLADQHGANSLVFKTYLTNEYANSGLDFDTKTKMMKDFQATVLGKTFLEEDAVLEAEKKLDGAATQAGFLTSDMDETQKEFGRMQYRAMLSKQEADAEELRVLNLRKAQVGLQASEIELIDKRIKEKSYESVANFASNYRPVVKNNISAIVEKFRSGAITNRQEAEQLLRTQMADISSVVGNLSRNMSKSEVEALAKPMYDLYEIAIASLDSAPALKDLQNQIATMEAKTELNLRLNNPELADVVGLSSMVNHSSPDILATMSTLTTRILKANSMSGTDSPANLVSGEKETGDYLNLVTNGIKNMDRLDPLGQPMTDPTELSTNVDNILKGTAKFMSSMDRPAKIKTLVKWMADPKVGEYIKGNMSKLSPEARANISDVLVQNAANYIYPALSGLISSEFMQGGKRQVKHEDVSVSVSNGKVVFKATNNDMWTASVADKMNREVGAAMTSYFNAIANVSGDSVEEVFDRELQTFWPEKAKKAQPEQQKEQEPTKTTDLSQYEGKAVKDEKGDIYTVRNGSWVKIGGSGNAKQ